MPSLQYNQTSTDTVPAATAITGSATAAVNSRVITGSGTSFLSQVKAGDYIVDFAVPQLREVDFVVSDTEIILKTAFGTAISNAAVSVASGGFRQASVRASGGDITTVDEEDNTGSILDGDVITPLVKTNGGVAPFVVQATTAATAKCLTVK